MSQATNIAILEESHISLLPIIDLHATDPSALYSVLLFATAVQDPKCRYAVCHV